MVCEDRLDKCIKCGGLKYSPNYTVAGTNICHCDISGGFYYDENIGKPPIPLPKEKHKIVPFYVKRFSKKKLKEMGFPSIRS